MGEKEAATQRINSKLMAVLEKKESREQFVSVNSRSDYGTSKVNDVSFQPIVDSNR
jgi:hypothetical protein